MAEEQQGGFYRVEVIASLFGVTVRRVQQLTQEGIISTTKTKEGNRYELAPTIQRYVKYLSDKAYGKSKSEKEAELREQKLQAEIALKESQGEMHRLKTEIASGKAYGMNLVLVDTGKYKDMIAGRMQKKNGSGSWMVYQGCDREYAEQVTAEHKVNVKMGNGKVKQEWQQKTSHADNHYLDCEVYATAAADILGVRTLHLNEIQENEQPKKQETTQYTPEEHWISQNEGSWV